MIATRIVATPDVSTETTFIEKIPSTVPVTGVDCPAMVTDRSMFRCMRYRKDEPWWKLMARAVPPELPPRPKKNTTAPATRATTRPRASAMRGIDRRPDGALDDWAAQTEGSASACGGRGAGGAGIGIGGASGGAGRSKRSTVPLAG